MDYSNKTLKNLMAWFDTDEGKKNIEDFAKKIQLKQDIKDMQLERFKSKGNFAEFVERVITKYNSPKYRDKWYNRGVEPPKNLYWFLFFYAEKFGRECASEEWEKYGNTFTSTLYFYEGYYFNRMDGQGSIIKIEKQ
jgi:hypothetical protein